ncbi:GAF domain-containing protein [Halopiger djelfimassiliensis]|uniref:GAF domain-containing protein n=1 Tax=Halopiger djelfimassiliensis TaxID=1293047 RepID=UPI000677D76A|nr:GAF domain-containing protein [Halopiger djelfimassiliensis]
MEHSSPRHGPRAILYVAANETAAQNGAAALERASAGPDRSVHPTTSVERVRNWASDVDCVVFAETPTTPAGAHLLEVVEACGSTPLVLYTESSYAATAAKSTDGIDGYVRQDTDDAVSHLVDEIAWVCHGEEPPGSDGTAESRTLAALAETTASIADCRDRERLFALLVEAATDALGREHCWVSTVNFGDLVPRTTAPEIDEGEISAVPLEGPLGEAFRTGEPLNIAALDDRDAIERPIEDARALCSVPVGDIGVLQIAADTPDAFDEADVEFLAGLCETVAAVLDRNRGETGLTNDIERLQREREQLAAERDRLETERERVRAERDRLLDLFANVPEPAIRYEIEDGEPIIRDVNDRFEAVFGDDCETAVGEAVDEYTVPPGLEDRAATLTDALRSGKRRQFETRRQTGDGVRDFVLTLVPCETTGAADGDAEHDTPTNPEGLLIYSDVTDSKRRDRELATATDRLETIVELVDDEVRTPLNVARGYLELAEKTGDREHFEVIENAHEQLLDRLKDLQGLARGDDVLDEVEPIAIRDAARRAWIALETGDAKLVTENDLVLEADRTRLRELFEYVLQTVLESEGATVQAAVAAGDADATEADDVGADAPPVTVTVGATDDGFYVAGDRPATDEDDGRHGTPAPGRLTAADGSGLQFELVERIADAHGWDVGVAKDEDGTAFAFRGVDAIDSE